MSAGIAHPGPQLADLMLGINQQIIMETLSTFFAYAAVQWKLEVVNYLPVTFLLVLSAMTSKHPDPNVILGVNPQSCFQAAFGRVIRRSYPDWNYSLFRKDMSCKPLLGFIWEEKRLEKPPAMGGAVMNMEEATVVAAAQHAMFFDIQQLQVQALCAFFQQVGDVVYAFLNYRECFFLFEFPRPSNWRALKDKYDARFPKSEDGKGKPSAIKFDKTDLPHPKIHYHARSLRNPDGSALSPVFLKAYRIATSHLGLLENQSSLFRMPPEITEEDLVQPNLDDLQQALDDVIENQNDDVFMESSSDPASVDDSEDGDFVVGSSSESSDGSASAGASEPPLSAPSAPKSGPSADTDNTPHRCPRCYVRDKKKQEAKKKRAAKKKQAAPSVPADDHDMLPEAGVENAASSSRRSDRTEPSRDVVDSPVVEPLADGAGSPEARIRVHYPPSHGRILTDPITAEEPHIITDPITVEEPQQMVAHTRESPDRSESLPVASDDEDIDDQPAALSTGRTAARAPKASNATVKTRHSAAAPQKRARPTTSALDRDDDDDETIGQRNAAGTTGSLQVALLAPGGGAKANTHRPQLRTSARLAASRTEQRDAERGADGLTAAQAPKASNATVKTGHPAAAPPQKRARPLASATTGLLQVALPAQQAGGGTGADTHRPQLRTSARLAASQTKPRDADHGARSEAPSGSDSKQKRRHAGDSDAEDNEPASSSKPSKKRKFPAPGDSALDSVAVEAGRSAMPVAGPSNFRTLHPRGSAPAPRDADVGKRSKKKGRAA